MITWLEALILGVVQGITEFLPVSSDGHLNLFAVLFQRWTGRVKPPEENLFFFLMLHLGTLAAILVHYRKEGLAGARGLLGSRDVAEAFGRERVVRVGVLVAIATAVLIPDKLFFLDYIEQAFEGLTWTGVGFLITASVLAVTASSLSGGDKGPLETTYLDALLVGVAQAFAPLPGVSRSGLTIAAALALGFRRAWAVQFSLMLAIPAILGASVFEIKDVDRSFLAADRLAPTLAAMVVAGLVGYVAIVWLARVVRSGKLWYFSVYLVVLGLAVIAGSSLAGKPTVGPTSSLHRTPRAVPEGSPPRRHAARGDGTVALPDRPREGSPHA